jgi:hypothetical protein
VGKGQKLGERLKGETIFQKIHHVVEKTMGKKLNFVPASESLVFTMLAFCIEH